LQQDERAEPVAAASQTLIRPADRRSDVDLLAAHVAGDRFAFAELMRRHYSHLWQVALRASYSREDAADALQDALLSAHRTANTFRADAAVRSWLHRIVLNACLDRIRRNKVRPTVPLLDHDHPAGTRDDMATGRYSRCRRSSGQRWWRSIWRGIRWRRRPNYWVCRWAR